MLSETLTEGLDQYAIGEKLRELRLKKKIGLIELGEHSGLSPAMISKIENGKLYPTLPTLLRLALVFSIGLDYFFTERRPRPVLAIVRKSDRLIFPSQPEVKDGHVSYRFESLDFPAVERKLTSFLAHFEPPPADLGVAPFHHHDGIEFLYLMTGRLALQFGEEVHQLNAGDSVYFEGSQLHGYARLGDEPCTGVVVTVP